MDREEERRMKQWNKRVKMRRVLSEVSRDRDDAAHEELAPSQR